MLDVFDLVADFCLIACARRSCMCVGGCVPVCVQFEKMQRALLVHGKSLPLAPADRELFVQDVVAFVRASWVPF